MIGIKREGGRGSERERGRANGAGTGFFFARTSGVPSMTHADVWARGSARGGVDSLSPTEERRRSARMMREFRNLGMN